MKDGKDGGYNYGGHILSNVGHQILEDSDADYILEYNDGGGKNGAIGIKP